MGTTAGPHGWGLPALGHRETGSETLLGQTQLLTPCWVPALLAGEVRWGGVAAGTFFSPLLCVVCLLLKSVGTVPGQLASPATGKEQSRGANWGTNVGSESGMINNSKKWNVRALDCKT